MTLAYWFADFDLPDDTSAPQQQASGGNVRPPTLALSARETTLIAAVRAGDVAAFRELFDTYAVPLLRFAHARLGSRAQAEDIVQQVFASLWMRRQTWSVSTSIGAYLFRAVRNLIGRERRDQDIEDTALEKIAERPEQALMYTPSDRPLDVHELQATLARALANMPPRPREVFLLSRTQHLRYHEIAATLGVSVKTVELHMARALAALRDALADWRR